MIGTLRQMLTCHWSARHVQRYLDADPAAPLKPEEITRLEEHLAICDKCTQLVAEYRALHRALSLWSRAEVVDRESVDRVREMLDTIGDEDSR